MYDIYTYLSFHLQLISTRPLRHGVLILLVASEIAKWYQQKQNESFSIKRMVSQKQLIKAKISINYLSKTMLQGYDIISTWFTRRTFMASSQTGIPLDSKTSTEPKY